MLNIESLFGRIIVGSSTYQYTKFGQSNSSTGPAVVAEGSAKPETSYSGTLYTDSVQTIAHWTKMSEQFLADDQNLVSIINEDMTYSLNKVIDSQLLTGTGSGQLKGLSAAGNYTDYSTAAGLASGD